MGMWRFPGSPGCMPWSPAALRELVLLWAGFASAKQRAVRLICGHWPGPVVASGVPLYPEDRAKLD